MRFLICGAAILAVTGLSFADLKGADKAQIVKNYKTASAAMSRKDVAGVAKLLTDDFTSTEQGKSQTKDEMVKDWQQRMATTKSLRAKLTPGKMTQKGDEVKVQTSFSFVATVVDPKSKKPSHMSNIGTSVDTWVKKNNGWMLRNITVKTNKTLIDGKPMRPHKV